MTDRRVGRRLRPALLLALAVLPAGGCATRGDDVLDVIAAASLRAAVEEIGARLVAAGDAASVRVQTGGSVSLARRVLELDLRPDVLLLADPALFEDLLTPSWTAGHFEFAGDALVLAHTARAADSSALDDGRWAEILMRPGVTVAMADPDLAPVGQRTLLALRLHDLRWPGAELETSLRAKIGRRHLRADVADLIAPLQAGAVDYAFMYASTAAGAAIAFQRLPPEIDLSEPARAADYARVAVEVMGRTPGERRIVRGAAIRVAAALPHESTAAARRFIALLRSDAGRAILERHGFRP